MNWTKKNNLKSEKRRCLRKENVQRYIILRHNGTNRKKVVWNTKKNDYKHEHKSEIQTTNDGRYDWMNKLQQNNLQKWNELFLFEIVMRWCIKNINIYIYTHSDEIEVRGKRNIYIGTCRETTRNNYAHQK